MSSEMITADHSAALAPASTLAIRVENLSKCFHIYDRPRQRLQQLLLAPIKSRIKDADVKYYREFWALKKINFEVHRGETVGIIGKNGSGKSTLLQIICGTLTATEGSVEVNGRIAALLELGSGFNPDFTGRENIYLNGSILGLSRQEIDERFAEIEAFADIGDFIDQQIKSYSSGMAVRLAFAVAINADPEILIVDEALSVGDELFQRKCFSRIEAIRQKGATILFVSHAGSAIVELCDRAILLDSGDKLTEGAPKQVVGNYQKMLYAAADRRSIIRQQIISGQAPTGVEPDTEESALIEVEHNIEESFDPDLKPNSTIEYEDKGARIRDAGIYTLSNVRVNNLVRGRSYFYRYNVDFASTAERVRFGMLIKTVSGAELGGAVSAPSVAQSVEWVEAGSSVQVQFEFACNLTPGLYFLNAGVTGISDQVETFLHRALDVAAFRVITESGCLATSIVDFHCVPTLTFSKGILN
ncbi:lipopolysaccharide transport system ATP-binding protein [Pseudomonas sp. NFIX10]|uniref:ABC transporter ATP-binding protein n=1 Tax=unclassified Pseudomonas TaxID=196821 RepID=UPI0008E861BE|nr:MULTISPECIES: ABC transporter ATP-binding protein [unclassified Pseudomonas]SFA70540.1 lipopolysaccharide transport system ATP-binding protein [Pseudomonas sp. NFIX10]SFE07165.1 lipopolysaccharide transport system ATP-binding protein [Pseudomonas sp. NFACC06-1]